MTRIAIEHLTEGTLIRFGKDAAYVHAINFDCSGYGVDLRYDETGEGYEEFLYVDAGGSVEFAGVGTPDLRPDSAVTIEEWEAKRDMNDMRSAVLAAELVRLHNDTAGYEAHAMAAE